MNKEVSLKSDLKTFNIDVEDIEMNPHFFEVLQEAIDKMREETLSKNFEVVLNNNLVEVRDKNTNYKITLGCRVSYADLEESISFIVRPDEKPSYEYLEQQCQKQKEVIDKAINDLNIILEIVREQPSGSDCWIIDRLEANKSILNEVSK